MGYDDIPNLERARKKKRKDIAASGDPVNIKINSGNNTAKTSKPNSPIKADASKENSPPSSPAEILEKKFNIKF